MPDRDPVAELDDLKEYLLGLCGEPPYQPGLEANRRNLEAEFEGLKGLAKGTAELADYYAGGGTHEERVRTAMGYPEVDGVAQQRIAELERQLAEARSNQPGAPLLPGVNAEENPGG